MPSHFKTWNIFVDSQWVYGSTSYILVLKKYNALVKGFTHKVVELKDKSSTIIKKFVGRVSP